MIRALLTRSEEHTSELQSLPTRRSSDLTVESGNRLIRLAFILHLDESETARTPGFTICHDTGTVNLAVPFEEAADGLFGGVEIQVAYEYVLHSGLLSI